MNTGDRGGKEAGSREAAVEADPVCGAGGAP